MIKEIVSRVRLAVVFALYMAICLAVIPATCIVFGADKAIECITYLEALFVRFA